MSAPIEIPLSKSKLALMVAASIAIVCIGFWFVINPPKIQNSFWGDPLKLAIVGYASILFFGICLYFFANKLKDSKPGLIISDEGITDNAGGLAGGLIPWSNIQRIYVMTMYNQKLIMIEVDNPEEYISRQKNFIKKKGMQANYNMYGTPLSITANALKIKFPELIDLLEERMQKIKFGESNYVIE